MASSNRMAMRLLSPRIQYLQRPARCTQIRASSRYSNPGKRSFTAAPAAAPSFLGGQSASIESNTPSIESTDLTLLTSAEVSWRGRKSSSTTSAACEPLAWAFSLTFFGLAAVLYNIDLDDLEQAEQKRRKGLQMDASDEANRKFQGKPVEIIGVGEDKRVVARGPGGDIDLVETGTSSVPHFPRTIHLPTSPDSTPAAPAQPNSAANPGNVENQEEYTLLGLGIRSVSFLSIQVYVVGMYVRTQDLSMLQEKLIHTLNETASTLIPSEKEDLKRRLLDPSASREIWTEMLRVPGLKTAWRIAPTRNTDFGHLRDGWITGINNRTREAKHLLKGAETEYESEIFGKAVGDFKTMFTGGKAPKGSTMILSRDAWGKLDVWFQAKPSSSSKAEPMELVGSVFDERISRLIWLGYLAGEKVSSEAARQGVVEGCVTFAGRPIGSAESRVV